MGRRRKNTGTYKQFQLAATNKPGQSSAKLGKTPPLKLPDYSDNKFEIDYFHLYESLYRKEVTDWQNARTARYDPFSPITYPLQQLYKDSMLDNHLRGAIENRILRVTNKEVVLKAPDGTVDYERSKYIQKRWFRQVIRKAMESKFYEYSMFFISDFSIGEIRGVTDIPRENIIPEKGVLLKDAFNPSGIAIPFRQFPNHLIFVQLNNEKGGILERIAPMTIYKRHSWASWDEFEQIFGVPIRIAKTMINTEKHKRDLRNWLEQMGTANYAIFDKQTDIEIKENQKSDAYNVFFKKIEVINKEISKGIVGQTMTMDDGSSQSQANVHLQIYQEITDADLMDVQDWASDDFLPVMRNLGYDIPEGYYVELLEKTNINPENKIKIDNVLLTAGYNLTREYIESTYDVQLDEENPRREPSVLPLSVFPVQQKETDFFD